MDSQLHSDGSSLPNKRRKLIGDANPSINVIAPTIENEQTASQPSPLRGVDRPITPPPSRRIRSGTPEVSPSRVKFARSQQSGEESGSIDQRTEEQIHPIAGVTSEEKADDGNQEHGESIPSPIQLTRIRDLSDAQNVDTIGLGEILGDPMIRECWNFNYLFDVDFVMQHFDPDIRSLVKVKVVHGFWKMDDERRLALLEAAERYPNVQLIGAYMPDPFGTHHSKMLILLRHDDKAQVIIHTANMIAKDWANMTQAVWRSPLLPLRKPDASNQGVEQQAEAHAIGTGARFQMDLLRYFDAYGKRLTDLTTQLKTFDFRDVRAAFIGSTPSRQKVRFAKPKTQTSWGWLGLGEVLSVIPLSNSSAEAGNDAKSEKPHIVIQISSIATLGPTPTWLNHFQSVLSRHNSTAAPPPKQRNFQSAATLFKPKDNTAPKLPKFSIIFPTPQEIRTSLDGYRSGGSIHMKLQSTTQQKQLAYMRPLFCHWNHQPHDPPPSNLSSPSPPSVLSNPDQSRRKAHRGPAAPHIKTYIRFSDPHNQESIDWAMLTSANLSKQAWGEVENKNGEVWIQSWEAGVVVWPGLFTRKNGEECRMVPVFGRDMPEGHGDEEAEAKGKGKGKVVGFRMPYDLPLEPYEEGELPWCASADYEEVDCKGETW